MKQGGRFKVKFFNRIYARHKGMLRNKLFGLLLPVIKPENFEEAIRAAKK